MRGSLAVSSSSFFLDGVGDLEGFATSGLLPGTTDVDGGFIGNGADDPPFSSHSNGFGQGPECCKHPRRSGMLGYCY